MDWLQRLLRFDARSLGLFRWLIGLTLITDLLHRWDWVRAFYSNEGVLPNHNHLFLIKEKGEVWSFYHSFSSVDEAGFAFAVTLFIYVSFTIGWHTRAFHALSLVCLVGLAGRNVLLDAPGNSVAIGILALTWFLPLGLRFGVDSLRRSFATFDEKTPRELDDRSRPAEPDAPLSLVPLVVLAFLALVYYGAALQQTGASWKDGSALYFALHVDRWTSASGVMVREAFPAGVLAIWTKALWIAELVVVPLAILPIGRRITRSLAVAAMLFHGLTLGMFFTYGLYGWSLVAAAALLVPEESWDALARRHPIEVYYDDDCGICLWCARLLKRLDLRNNIRFRANSGPLPEGVSEETADRSIVVVDGARSVYLDAAAIGHILRALPLLWPLGWLILVPGPKHLVDWAYRKVAARRLDLSVAFGLSACGLPDVAESTLDSDGAAEPASYRRAPQSIGDEPPSPAARTGRWIRAAVASSAAALVFLAVAAQTVANNQLGTSLGLSGADRLATAARWLRITAPWGIWAPDPPKENASLVIAAETRSGWKVDPLTGYEPDLELTTPARHRKGVLWEAYQRHIQDDEQEPFRSEFRRYLLRGGFAIDTKNPDMSIKHLSAYWVTAPIPPPGDGVDPTVERREVFTEKGGSPRAPTLDRGGRLPSLRPVR